MKPATLSDNQQDSVEEVLRKNFPHGHSEFIPLMMRLLDLHSRKNKDYAGGGNPLGNFHRVANLLSQYPNLDPSDPRVVALTYAFKQIDAVMWLLCTNRDGEVEGISDRLQDIAVYCMLAMILDGERKSDELGA